MGEGEELGKVGSRAGDRAIVWERWGGRGGVRMIGGASFGGVGADLGRGRAFEVRGGGGSGMCVRNPARLSGWSDTVWYRMFDRELYFLGYD